MLQIRDVDCARLKRDMGDGDDDEPRKKKKKKKKKKDKHDGSAAFPSFLHNSRTSRE